MERVDNNTDISRIEALGDVQCLRERGDHPAVRSVVGFMGSMPKVTPSSLGVWHQPLDGQGRAVPGGLEIAVARRQPTRDQHQGRRLKCRGLLERLPVARLRGPRLVGIRGREEPAAAERGDPQARLADQAACLVQAHLGQLLAPDADPAEPGVDAALDRLGQRPRAVVRWLSDSRPSAGPVRHRTTPDVASRRRDDAPPARGRSAAGPRWPARNARQVKDRPSRLQATDHHESVLVTVQPGQEHDPSLVVVRRRGEEMARQRQRRGHLPAVRLDVVVVQRAQGRRRGRRDRGEGTEQRIGVVLAVALDELGIVEVVAGVEPDTVRQHRPQLLLVLGRQQRDLHPVDLRGVFADQIQERTRRCRDVGRPQYPASCGSNISPSQCRMTGRAAWVRTVE